MADPRRSTVVALGALLAAGALARCACPEQREVQVAPPARITSPFCAALPAARVEHRVDSDAAWAKVVAEVAPGDHVVLAAGTYAAPRALPSGTPDAPVVLRAAKPGAVVIRGPLDLGEVRHLRVRGLLFVSDGSWPWIASREGSHHLRLEGNAFDVDCFGCGQAFLGLDLAGDDHLLCNNHFGSWVGDMVSLRPARRALFVDNDLSQTQADHAVLSFLGQDLRVRGNLFRNPWDRVLHAASLEPDTVTRRVVVEHNVFVDSDWDHERERYDALGATLNDGGGAMEAVRFNGLDHIFRDNLVLATQRGNEWPCHAGLVSGTFADPPHWVNERNQHLRIYHNTFHANDTGGLSVTDGGEFGRSSDNLIAHNVFSDSRLAAVSLCAAEVAPDMAYLRGNLFSPDETVQIGWEDGGRKPLAEQVRAHPAFFTDNVSGAVRFVDGDPLQRALASPGELALDDLPAFFAGFQLEGAAAAPPLTTLAEAAVSATTLHLDDATCFSDGQGMVEGDRLRVGEVETRVVARVDASTLEVDPAVSAAAGAGVWWAPAQRALGVIDASWEAALAP